VARKIKKIAKPVVLILIVCKILAAQERLHPRQILTKNCEYLTLTRVRALFVPPCAEFVSGAFNETSVID
jgi:hypothetical protein